MNDNIPIYNSRITKTYLEYLRHHYPEIEVNPIIEAAGMTPYEVADPAHWFTQHQVDLFQEALIKTTGNPNIAREAGRYTTSYEGMGPIKQYTLGLISPTSVYLLIGKIGALMTRGSTVTARKLGTNKVEIKSTPNPGVKEKPYQCSNRIGTFESLAKLFMGEFATVDHPLCFHKGDVACQYIITWKKTFAVFWKQIRNIVLLLCVIASVAFFFTLSFNTWINLTLLSLLMAAIFSCFAGYLEKKELVKMLETQGNAAQDLINEMNFRHDNALLVQEIGQATSTILDIDKLIQKVVQIMENRIDFDRGMIMLANKEKTRLVYKAGYGYTEEQKQIVRQTEFHLDNPNSRGIFVVSYSEKKPVLINDIGEIKNTLSKKSLEFAHKMGAKSLICIPIIYENESLGVLCVDNIISRRALAKSDMNFLIGIASQTAISIINAMSFQKLQESEKKYRDLVENANSIIMRRDTIGKITFFNEFAQKYFGYAENEILGKNISETISQKSGSSQKELDSLLKILKKNPDRPLISENQNVLNNGKTVWIAWTYKPIFNNQGRLKEILCIGNDITELKRTEQEKRELEVRLQRAEKMEAIGTLAGGVAHDLNNILSGLVSYPELLLMDIPPGSPLRKPILTIQKSGEKAASIVQDLLTLARRGVAITSVVNLNDIVTEYLDSPEHEKLSNYHQNVQVISHLDSNLFNILGSPVHLSKTLMNLIFNAAEAMPNGGKVIIGTENRYIDKPIKGYDEVKEGNYITLTVKDTGIGISSKDMERIFEPFYSKKIMGKSGTGLGMAVIWGTIKDHKGYIDLQSTEGIGTTVTLYFPVTKQELINQKPLSTIDDLVGNGESILVVDDIEEQREIAFEMLNKLGYAVKTVSSGEEAVEYVQTHSVDLLILDMIMTPGIDGLDTYKRIKKVHPGQKAIIVSGYSESARVKESQKLGAGAYVKKPYLLESFGLAVRNELDKRQ